MELENKIVKFINEKLLIKKGDIIIIGMSGGPDSVALFYLLKNLKELELKIIFAHVNHMARGNNSDGDELFVKKLALDNKIDFFILNENVKEYAQKNKIGFEEAGREIRYNFFEEIKIKTKADKVALAHILDDNIETFMFRLMRGTSLNGLSAIPYKRDYFIRPLLNTYKEELITYLKKNKYEYRIDESNLESIYTRNKIRLELIPLIEKEFNVNFKEKINNLIEEVSSVNNFINKEIMEFNNKENLLIEELLEKDVFLQKKIINNFLSKYDIEISNRKILKILLLLKKGGTAYLKMGNGFIIKKNYNYIFIEQEIDNININKDVFSLIIGEEVIFNNFKIKAELVDKIKKENKSFFIDYNKLNDKNKLIIRSRRDGDSFYPVGMKGSKKLKKFFIDNKIEKDKRDEIPIILDCENIVWVGGLRGSEKYKVQDITDKILKLSIEEV